MNTTRHRRFFAPVASLCLAAGMLMPVATAAAQLAPDRLYYGIGRPMPFEAKVPAGKTGDVSIQLFTHGAKDPSATQSAAAGKVDLASLFPQLWKDANPQCYYAQLVVGTERIGPPVVLQPLLEGPTAVNAGGKLQWQPGHNPYSGIRAYVEKHVLLETTAGDIEIHLRPDQAPNTCWNFRELAEGGFYTDILFHRIIGPAKMGEPFVIQVGDPTGTGGGGPGYNIDLEQSRLAHDYGVVSMARENEPNTNGSQIFICLSKATTTRLNGGYCAFGQTVAGVEAIEKISATPVNEADRPVDEVKGPRIKTARLVDAPPFGSCPAPVARPGMAPAGDAKPAGR